MKANIKPETRTLYHVTFFVGTSKPAKATVTWKTVKEKPQTYWLERPEDMQASFGKHKVLQKSDVDKILGSFDANALSIGYRAYCTSIEKAEELISTMTEKAEAILLSRIQKSQESLSNLKQLKVTSE